MAQGLGCTLSGVLSLRGSLPRFWLVISSWRSLCERERGVSGAAGVKITTDTHCIASLLIVILFWTTHSWPPSSQASVSAGQGSLTWGVTQTSSLRERFSGYDFYTFPFTLKIGQRSTKKFPSGPPKCQPDFSTLPLGSSSFTVFFQDQLSLPGWWLLFFTVGLLAWGTWSDGVAAIA